MNRFDRRYEMKRYVLGIVLMSMLVPAAFCQEFEEQDIERQMELRGMELKLQHAEEQMAIERQMQELELEERRLELDRAGREHKPKLHPLLLVCLVVNILVAVWVYMDIRKRNLGSGIWIVIALLTGLLGALVYAVVRLGDERQKES
jgi:hypothetical protein